MAGKSLEKQVEELVKQRSDLASRVEALEAKREDQRTPVKELSSVVSELSDARRVLAILDGRLTATREALNQELAERNREQIAKLREEEAEAEEALREAVQALHDGPLARLVEVNNEIVALGGGPRNNAKFVFDGVQQQLRRWQFIDNVSSW